MKKPLPKNLLEFLSRTGNLLIHLLDRCNLHCKHCYLHASENGKHMLPFDLVNRTLNEANDLGIKSIQLSGGEPFLYPHILEVLKLMTGKNYSVSISTNGTLITEVSAKLLAKINASVVTSIDGPPNYHDKFRGEKESFVKTEKGIERLKDLGVPIKIVVTICKDNLKFIDWCANWAYNIKADSVVFQSLENIGRGKGIENKRLLGEKLNDLFIYLNDLAVFYAPKGLQIKMPYERRDFMITHPCSAFVCNGKNCYRGIEQELKKIVIREDGIILPELVDIDRQYAIGDLHKDTLKNNLLDYLKVGYLKFDNLCREVYNDTVLTYPSPLIPWNEILTKRSRILR